MTIMQIGTIGIIAVILIMGIKREVPQYAMLISLATGVLIMLAILPELSKVIELLKEISGKISIDGKYIVSILKITGIACISEFCSQLCIDAGEGSIATKIELAGKIIIISLSLPLLINLLESIMGLL